MNTRIPLDIPHGWFCLSWSHELKIGQVKIVKFCGQDAVLFRAESGEANAVAPFCPHLGAHLGHGGKVIGESISCPFHGWAWSGEGKCTDVPYADSIPKKALSQVLDTYNLVEQNGIIMAWYHPEGKEPYFELPLIDEFNGESNKWGKSHFFEYNISTCLQEIAENDVDQAHFPTVHQSPSLPETEAFIDGIYKKTIAETLMDPENSESVSEKYKGSYKKQFTTTFTRESWGLGQVLLRMTNLPPTGGEFIMVNASCPVDTENSILRWEMKVSKDIEDTLGMAIIDGIANGINDDIPIWENKSYWPSPMLCDGDGPINKFRKWVGQFYI